MGRDKALLPVGGRPLAVVAAEALHAAGADRVFAVGGDGDGLRAAGLEAVADDHPGEGPLGGILTALRVATSDVVVVLACDLPAADATAVRAVLAALGDAEVAAPVRDGRHELLHAAYRQAARAHLEAAFAGGERAVHRACRGLDLVAVEGLADHRLDDADEPGDLPGP